MWLLNLWKDTEDREIHHWLREGNLSEESLYSKVIDPFPDSRVKYICISCFFKSSGKFGYTGLKVEIPRKHSFEIFLFCFVQLLSTKSKCFSLCLAAIILNPYKMHLHYVTILLIFIKYHVKILPAVTNSVMIC